MLQASDGQMRRVGGARRQKGRIRYYGLAAGIKRGTGWMGLDEGQAEAAIKQCKQVKYLPPTMPVLCWCYVKRLESHTGGRGCNVCTVMSVCVTRDTPGI